MIRNLSSLMIHTSITSNNTTVDLNGPYKKVEINYTFIRSALSSYHHSNQLFNSSVLMLPNVDCFRLKIVGAVSIGLFLSSLVFNSLLLCVFYSNRKLLRSTSNVLIVVLTFFNLIGSIFEYPFVILSNLSCRWLFDYSGCIFSGWVMYFVGIASIYLMTIISIEKYYVVKNPSNIHEINKDAVYLTCIFFTLFSLIWSFLPMIGWSYYSLEGTLTSCSIEWNARSFNVISYNVITFILFYLLPLIAIGFTNINLIIKVKKMKILIKKAIQNDPINKRLTIERGSIILILLLIVFFMISWTPYALVSMYSAFIKAGKISPFAASIPALFAKTSMTWPAILCIFSDMKIRKATLCFLDYGNLNRESSSMNLKIINQGSKPAINSSNQRLYKKRAYIRKTFV